MSIHLLLIYLVAAALAGIIAGLFGGGIGLILVPAMVWILTDQGVPTEITMHIAIGTSVAAIIAIGFFSAYSHHKRGGVDWPLFKKMSIAMIIGIIIGALVAKHLPSQPLIIAFGIVTLLLALYVFFSKDEIRPVTASNLTLSSGAAFIGFFGSTLGLNSFCVPFLRKIGVDIRKAVGTTAVIGALLALGIAVMYAIIGLGVKGLPKYSTGYIDWLACIPLAIGGSFFSPLGAKIAHVIPRRVLKWIYAAFLIVVGVKMLLTGVH